MEQVLDRRCKLGKLVESICIKEFGEGVWYSGRAVYKRILELHPEKEVTQDQIARYVTGINKRNKTGRFSNSGSNEKRLTVKEVVQKMKGICERYSLDYGTTITLLKELEECGTLENCLSAVELLKELE